jgi:hypothetical protein
MVKFAASDRKKLTGLCIGMIVCAAFVLVFQILHRAAVEDYSFVVVECSLPALSIVAAGLGLAAAKTVQYKSLLRAHETMCLISGIVLIIPTLYLVIAEIWTTIEDGQDMSALNREQAIGVAKNIFVLVLAALMFASNCLICQWQTKKGLCCSGCCDYVGDEEEVIKPIPPSYSAGNLQVQVCKNHFTNSVQVENPNFTEGPTLQNVPSEIATTPSLNAKVM